MKIRECLNKVVLLSAIVSCQPEDLPPVLEETGYPIEVEVESPAGMQMSKSSFHEYDLTKVTDLNIFVYHDGTLLKEHSRYFPDVSSLMLSFPYDKDVFNIYMVGNVGRIEAPEDESDIDEVCCFSESYDDFKTKGFPVANVFYNHRKGTLALFVLKRLAGQYDIVFSPSAVSADYVVKDVRLLNCALDVYPFSTDTRARKFTAPEVAGDMMTEDDIARLNAGEPVSLFFVENLQGELLPGNTDKRKKIPSVVNDIEEGLADCCTYIEITADVTTESARYADAKYRFYLGQNETSDFSIRRNTLYKVNLDFTQNMVSEEEWRIEVNEPEINALTLSKEVAHVIKGVNDYILIYGPKVRIKAYDDDAVFCHLEDVVEDGVRCQKLWVGTDEDITGMYDWQDDYRNSAEKHNIKIETIETFNGRPLLERNITACVYDKVFPVFLRMGRSIGKAAPYRLEAVTNAPVPYEFALSANLDVEVDNSGVRTSSSHKSSSTLYDVSDSGNITYHAGFTDLYNSLGSSAEKKIYFRRMDVGISGVKNECCSVSDFYMGDGGETYWGPGPSLFPAKFPDVSSTGALDCYTVHSCNLSGCIKYSIQSGGSTVFLSAPRGRTCSTMYNTGTDLSLSYDVGQYNTGRYMPFYIINGTLDYRYPVTMMNESAKYLDDSARVSIIYEMPGPGRDVFYPNGVSWGSTSGGSPSGIHRFGFTAGLVKQFFGNIHTWQIYQAYECDFFMTVNGCTAWPGGSNLDTGFKLAYNL